MIIYINIYYSATEIPCLLVQTLLYIHAYILFLNLGEIKIRRGQFGIRQLMKVRHICGPIINVKFLHLLIPLFLFYFTITSFSCGRKKEMKEVEHVLNNPIYGK